MRQNHLQLLQEGACKGSQAQSGGRGKDISTQQAEEASLTPPPQGPLIPETHWPFTCGGSGEPDLPHPGEDIKPAANAWMAGAPCLFWKAAGMGWQVGLRPPV